MRRAVYAGLGVGVLALSFWALRHPTGPSCPPSASRHALAPSSISAPSCPASARPGERPASSSRALQTPTGSPAQLRCDEARKVVSQARAYLASEPPQVDPSSFAEALIDWLDPHGLWSASPDSPLAPAIRRHARALVSELEAPPGDGPCSASSELGASAAAWSGDLRAIFAESERGAPSLARGEAFKLAQSPAFEDGPVTRPSRELAAELGRRVGSIHRAYGGAVDEAAGASVARALPSGSDVDWQATVLAAAVRAYLPQIDPHGGWAPLDEETSLYEIDLEANPPPRLWRKMARTAVGIRVDETSARVLAPGEVILSVGEVPTACLSVEQAEQLAYVDVEGTAPLAKRVVVLGPNDDAPRQLEVRLSADPSAPNEERAGGLEATRVPYGAGEALVVAIGDVPDNLGEELSTTLMHARDEGPLVGVVLDLRGNGGGSTDGASSALGVILPGVSLFPLRRRDGSIEVERAPSPPPLERWGGPVAALVDGDTASAAEMIAGAIAAYHRGPVVGERTYGKGCAQEYLDDDAHVGVLRLTTLVYALPDGSPVQMIGLSPSLRLPLERAKEREANLLHALRPWQGPDVRDRTMVRETPWPGHAGTVGPCADAVLCRALRALGSPRAAIARGSASVVPSRN